MHLEGYIGYKNGKYTFVYENDFLTMINYNLDKPISSWNKREEVEYF